MVRLLAALVLLLSSVVVVAAAAGKQCLKPQEAEAERAIRFQAELMVMSDTCGQKTYSEFSQRNREALAGYQRALIAHFRRTGVSRAEAHFDSYLTHLANEASLRTGARPMNLVCQEAAPFFATAESFGKEEFRHYIAEHADEVSPEFRRCPVEAAKPRRKSASAH
jgi:hypothetical protein